jgi:hypothetical protein
MGLFSKNSGSSTGKVGRAAKPGEVVNRKGKPVTTRTPGTRVVGSQPRTGTQKG